MTTKSQKELNIEQLDDTTCIIYLNIPSSKIVVFQAYFELTEGLGIVRTLDAKSSLIALLTTQDMLSSCLTFLESIKQPTHWRAEKTPSEEQKKLYLGYRRSKD